MESPEKDCPFCAILRGEEGAARIVCKRDSWIAFFPLEPAVLGHTLVVPRQHVAHLWESTSAVNAELMEAVEILGQAIRASLNPDGLNLITSAGTAAEQSVAHLHLHLVPRWTGDSFGPIWPSEAPHFSDDELDSAAVDIRGKCAGGA